MSFNTLDQDKIECAEFVIRRKKNPDKVIVNNESLIMDEYKRVIPEKKELDLNKIKDELKRIKERNSKCVDEKDMQSFAGAHLESNYRVEIK